MLNALSKSHAQKRLWVGLFVAGVLLLFAAALSVQHAFGAATIGIGKAAPSCMSSYYAEKSAQGIDVPTSCSPLWQTVTHPDAGYLRAIAAISANDVYAVGTGGVLHWNGTAWTLARSGDYSAVAGIASNDVWVWEAYTGPVHWNGSSWTQFTAPINGVMFDVLVMGDTSHAWAGGLSDFQGSYARFIDYWNGTTWVHVTTSDLEQGSGLLSSPGITKPSGGGCEPYNHITGAVATGPHDAWFVGISGSSYPCNTGSSVFYHLVDGVPQSCCTAIPANIAMGRAGSGDFWSVGSTFTSTTSIAHFTGGTTWSPVASPNIGALTGVSGSSPTDVWAVNVNGFLHYNGAYWTAVSTGGQGATAVAAISSQDAWAINNTTILHYQGTEFTDVALENTFYGNINCLYCRGIMSGYSCGGTNPQTGAPEPCDTLSHPYFRYNNTISRGQISKLVANSAGFAEDPGAQVFEDVPPGSTFYPFVNRLVNRGFMTGYPCGGAGEPCVAPGNRPYFRPGKSALRAQLTKIVSNAAGFSEAHTETSFQDVPTSSPFYIFVERLYTRSVLGGYPCGGSGEPCVAPGNLPYFRPSNLVSRGQSARITGNAFFPNCVASGVPGTGKP